MFSKNIKNSIGPYQKNCDGYGNPGASGNCYVLGFVLGTGVTNASFAIEESNMLDKIIAFDKAEVESATIGQINLITVSSFCGPIGAIWGYDIARHDSVESKDSLLTHVVDDNDRPVPVYKLDPLLEATQSLFGTVDRPVFPFMPGSHVPAAAKDLAVKGPAHIYAAVAIGIACEREKHACLLMENVGLLPANLPDHEARKVILEKTAASILPVGKNQKVAYERIFVGMKDVWVPEGQVGCALVAAPYFTLAMDAVPEAQPERLISMSLSEWIGYIKHRQA